MNSHKWFPLCVPKINKNSVSNENIFEVGFLFGERAFVSCTCSGWSSCLPQDIKSINAQFQMKTVLK